MITYLRNTYVEIIQISYYSSRTVLSYKESDRFTGTTLVLSAVHIEIYLYKICFKIIIRKLVNII